MATPATNLVPELVLLSDINRVHMKANAPGCVVYDFDLPKPFDNTCEARICQSYPTNCYVTNKECDELLYIVSGCGSLDVVTSAIKTPDGYDNIKTKVFHLKPGSVMTIPKGTIFRYNIGNLEGLKMFVTTQPKFRPEQHVLVDKFGNPVSARI